MREAVPKWVISIGSIVLLLLVLTIGVFKYYHPTYYAYNDRFVIGSRVEAITEKYGPFYNTEFAADGTLYCGIYMIRDNTPEFIMGYDDSLWYEVYFTDGVAVSVKLREGYIGG